MSSISSYRPLFDPAASKQRVNKVGVTRRADETPEGGYVYDAENRIALAVNVALATGRPLLIRGKPGTGRVRSRRMLRHDWAGATTNSS